MTLLAKFYDWHTPEVPSVVIDTEIMHIREMVKASLGIEIEVHHISPSSNRDTEFYIAPPMPDLFYNLSIGETLLGVLGCAPFSYGTPYIDIEIQTPLKPNSEQRSFERLLRTDNYHPKGFAASSEK
jgi:hypothetical protein